MVFLKDLSKENSFQTQIGYKNLPSMGTDSYLKTNLYSTRHYIPRNNIFHVNLFLSAQQQIQLTLCTVLRPIYELMWVRISPRTVSFHCNFSQPIDRHEVRVVPASEEEPGLIEHGVGIWRATRHHRSGAWSPRAQKWCGIVLCGAELQAKE
jgi:hypothetical protein